MPLVEDHHRGGVLGAVEDAAGFVIIQHELDVGRKLPPQVVHVVDGSLDAWG